MKASKMKIINSIFKTFVLSALMVAQVHFAYAQNAAILPPAKTTFVDQNGKPLTSGKVYFYIPGTNTFKTTWQDSAGTIPNTNPVQLDAAGRALILGNGAYRQVVKDRLNNQQWDQVTNSAGAGGSGSVTVGDGNAVGTVLPYSGIVAPSNYAFPYGQELSRTTYAQLLSAITITQNVTCISGNATVTTVADTSQLNIGGAVEAACLPAATTIISKTSNTVTLSANATVSVTTSAVFYPWGNGNGLTTFNAPDLRGVILPGRNNMGGSNSVNLSTPYYTDPNSIAGAGGSQNHTIITSEMASHNHVLTDPGHSHTEVISAAGGAANQIIASTGSGVLSNSAINTTTNTTGITANATGGGIAVSATVAAGGSGYSAGTQLLTVIGGTCTIQPQFNVTISAGAITAPVLVTAGDCSVVPANPVSTSGGGGTAGTLTVIWSARPFSVIQPSKTINYILKVLPDVNLSIARCANLIDAGTACTYNVGTSGNTIPLNNTANTFSAAQTFSSGIAVSGGSTSITALVTPTSPTDAANKAYVDSVATGLNILAQSGLATAAILPNTPTYSNGASGVGATLTAGSNTTLTVDGTAAPLNTVVLVKNQASAFQNGIYTVTQAGSGAAPWILTRATYFDQAAEMKAGSYTLITGGATNIGTSWALQTAVTTVGTDPLNWIQFSATAGVTSVGGFNGIVTNAQVTSSCNIFTGVLSGCVPSGSGATTISQLNPSTQTWVTPTSLLVQSRTTAATLDLTNVNTVKTLGYSSAGDGGEATFIRTTNRFYDTVVSSGTITNAGSLYTNGTYLYVPLTGSATGLTTYANITVTANVVASVTILDANGRGAASLAGDVLTTANTNIGGTGSGFTWTISAMTSPLASFTDSAGNRFQYVVSGSYINPRQFGCKFDWVGVDATATDDGACLQASLNFASIAKYARQDLGGTLASTKVMLPAGSALLCQGLIIPGATQLFGQGPFNSILKYCDTGLATATHLITVCDQNAHVACFGPQIGQLGINAFNANASANTYAIYSNAAQQTRYLDNVNIYSGKRGCIKYEVGYGGAANVSMYDIFCTINTAAPNDGININVGSTLVNFKNVIIESGGSGFTGDAFHIEGGLVTVDGYHTEGITTGMNVHVTTPTHSVVLMNASGGGNCTELVKLQNGNVPGNFAIFNAIKQGVCTNLVTNGQPAGSNRVADAIPANGWVFFNP